MIPRMTNTVPRNRLRRRRVHVVTLIDTLGIHGGAEAIALGIAERLDPERFQSTLCVSRGPLDGDLGAAGIEGIAEIEARGVRLFGLGRRGTADVWAWERLLRRLRRDQVDVLHAHKFGSNVWGTIVGRLARVPVVLAHEHSWEYKGRPLRRLLDRHLIARYADRLIAVSREDQRRMVEVEGIARERTLFVPNGIPASSGPTGHDLRAELGIAPDAPVIGSVGSLYPVKAFDVLIRATASLRKEHGSLHTVIAGGGTELEPLTRLARELGVDRCVHLLGARGDVPDILAAVDVAVCCSRSEGSPLSVMEYMQAGRAVVATAVGGVPDLIEPGAQGLLVPPEDPDALAAALAVLLGDPDLAHTMGDRARERQRMEFDIDVLVARLENLYLELLGARAAQTFPGAPART